MYKKSFRPFRRLTFIVLLFFIFAGTAVYFFVPSFSRTKSSSRTHASSGNAYSPVYGITLNHLTAKNEKSVLTAIRHMHVRPTVRVVMSPNRSAAYYLPLLKKLHSCATILLCPCDSSYMKDFPSVSAYQKRFDDCADTLAPYVDIWEIGNEVNGEGWLGADSQSVSDRCYAAWKDIHNRKMATELTPYAFAPHAQSISMEKWMKTYIPHDMRLGLNFVLVSYYDADNQGKHENWQQMFSRLTTIFPHAALGFGECGYPAPHDADASCLTQIDAYYHLPKMCPHYVGGGFWWYWQTDCVPYCHNAAFLRIDNDCRWMKSTFTE